MRPEYPALHKPREHPVLWDVSIHLLEISPHYAHWSTISGGPRDSPLQKERTNFRRTFYFSVPYGIVNTEEVEFHV